MAVLPAGRSYLKHADLISPVFSGRSDGCVTFDLYVTGTDPGNFQVTLVDPGTTTPTPVWMYSGKGVDTTGGAHVSASVPLRDTDRFRVSIAVPLSLPYFSSFCSPFTFFHHLVSFVYNSPVTLPYIFLSLPYLSTT